jgi:hypothetical protein
MKNGICDRSSKTPIFQLDMVTKPKFAYKSTMYLSYVLNTVCVLHISATLDAIFREMHY